MGMSAYERRDYRDFAPTSTKIDELIKELEGDLDRAMPEQTWRLYPEMVCTAEFIELFYKKTKGCVLGRKFSFEMFHGPADADEQLKRGPGWAFYIRTSQGFIELWISHFISLIHPYHQGTPSYEFLGDSETTITELVEKISADVDKLFEKMVSLCVEKK